MQIVISAVLRDQTLQMETAGASENQKVSGPFLPKSGAVAMLFPCLFRPFGFECFSLSKDCIQRHVPCQGKIFLRESSALLQCSPVGVVFMYWMYWIFVDCIGREVPRQKKNATFFQVEMHVTMFKCERVSEILHVGHGSYSTTRSVAWICMGCHRDKTWHLNVASSLTCQVSLPSEMDVGI